MFFPTEKQSPTIKSHDSGDILDVIIKKKPHIHRKYPKDINRCLSARGHTGTFQRGTNHLGNFFGHVGSIFGSTGYFLYPVEKLSLNISVHYWMGIVMFIANECLLADIQFKNSWFATHLRFLIEKIYIYFSNILH